MATMGKNFQPFIMAEERAARSVFVGNIPYEATEEQLKDIFNQAGPVASFRLVYDRETGKPKGYGFCEYQDVETAQSAMRNLNNHDFNGRPLRVGVAAGEQAKEENRAMQQALGGPMAESPYGEPVDPEKAPEAISKAVASLPPEQMFELMKQMKLCIQNNPNEARNMLLQNPQLAYALLQAQIVMKIVDPQVALAMLHRQSEQIPPVMPSNNVPHQPAPVNLPMDNRPPLMTAPRPPASLTPPMGNRFPIPNRGGLAGDGPVMDPREFPNVRQNLPPRDFPPRGNPKDWPELQGPPRRDGPPFGGMDHLGGGSPFDPQNDHHGLERRDNLPPIDRRDIGFKNMHGVDPRGLSPRGNEPNVEFGQKPIPGLRPGFPGNMNAPRNEFNQQPRMMGPTGPRHDMMFDMRPPGSYRPPLLRENELPPRMNAPGLPAGNPRMNAPVEVRDPRQAAEMRRNQGPVAPRMMMSNPAPGPASSPVSSNDQEKAALIMQVLQLSDEQIAMLPIDQRQSILILKEQIARSANPGDS